jgi:hypothetical protein
VRSLLTLAAALYVAAYLLAAAWRRRAAGRVVVICPLRDPGTLPQEIVERLGPLVPADERETAPRAEFTIAFRSDAPGIALAAVTDASSLEARVGPHIRDGIFTPAPDWWHGLPGRGRWSAGLLFDLALEVLHRSRPRSLLVDLRSPPREEARALGITAHETDADLAMYAYEIRCRLRRYSGYRDTPCDLLFRGEAGASWRLSG